MKPSDIFSFIIFLNNKLFSYSWGQLFTPTNKLNLHLILTKFVFYKMLKDYELDESGIVFLEGIQLAFIILYYFRYNQLFVFCQTIQTRVYAVRPYTVSKIRSRPYLSEKKCETVCRLYGLIGVFSMRPYEPYTVSLSKVKWPKYAKL